MNRIIIILNLVKTKAESIILLSFKEYLLGVGLGQKELSQVRLMFYIILGQTKSGTYRNQAHQVNSLSCTSFSVVGMG